MEKRTIGVVGKGRAALGLEKGAVGEVWGRKDGGWCWRTELLKELE